MAKNNVINLLTNGAKNLSGKYNLPSYKNENGKHHAEWKKAFLHQQTCRAILAFAAEHPEIPLYAILALGINQGACRVSYIEKGLTKFNADKVLETYQMAMMYNEYNGIKTNKPSDVTIRLMDRFYNKVGGMDTFMVRLAATMPLGKECGKRGSFKTLCANLGMGTDESPTEETASAA